jgi:hypothetical protein
MAVRDSLQEPNIHHSEMATSMKRSVGVTTAALSFLAFSTVLICSAYYIVRDAFPVVDFDDDVHLSFGIIYGLVAVWSLTTMVGILRLRPWARVAALWLGVAAGLVYFLPLGWYVYGVRTTPDVGWSWEAIIPLPAFLALAVWWLTLFSRPTVKLQFAATDR